MYVSTLLVFISNNYNIQKMKILLINSPIRLDAKPSCIPYGLATIAGTLRESGFDVEIYDVNALRLCNDEVVKVLNDKEWDIVGVSGLVTTYNFQKWIIGELKKINPDSLVVCGGGLATSNSDLLFKNSEVDITVIGEGELTMLELCKTIRDGNRLETVLGIWFRKSCDIVENELRVNIADLDKVAFPAWDLLPLDVYLNNSIWGGEAGNSSGFKEGILVSKSMNIISSRGCPFMCNYCYHLFHRSNYRFRSAQNVVNEMEILVDQYGVDFVGFVDDNFMASEKRLLEFCDLIEEKQFDLSWGCHGRVTSANVAILKRMAEVSCVWIGYGIESGSQEMLNCMNKKSTVEQAKLAITNTREAGIFTNTTFIFGYPGETKETVQETIDFKRELEIECGSFFATPYPGTPLYESIKNRIEDEEKFIQSLGNATEFTINLTGFDDEKLFRLKDDMDNNRDVV